MLCGRMSEKNPAFLQRPDFGLYAVYRLWFYELLLSTNGDWAIVDLKYANIFEYQTAYYTME